jgi:hypothetical protein
MRLEKKIKIMVDGKIDFARILIDNESIEFHYYDFFVKIRGDSPYPLILLQQLREKLENRNIELLIKGSIKNLFVRGVMALGIRAYVIKLGDSNLVQTVDIFEDIEDLNLVATVRDQKQFLELWKKSLK